MQQRQKKRKGVTLSVLVLFTAALHIAQVLYLLFSFCLGRNNAFLTVAIHPLLCSPPSSLNLAFPSCSLPARAYFGAKCTLIFYPFSPTNHRRRRKRMLFPKKNYLRWNFPSPSTTPQSAPIFRGKKERIWGSDERLEIFPPSL